MLRKFLSYHRVEARNTDNEQREDISIPDKYK